nr:hypothetical protein Itr_chr11CG09490 [Ipomoea trifida]
MKPTSRAGKLEKEILPSPSPPHNRPHPRHRCRTPVLTHVTAVARYHRRTPDLTHVTAVSRYHRRTLDLTPPPPHARLAVTPKPLSHISTAGRFQCFIKFIHFGC